MKAIQGTIEFSLRNRRDGLPLLNLRAVGKEGRKALTRFHEGLEVVRLLALKQHKADIYNVCGSQTKCFPEETLSLTIGLALGGIGVRRDPRLRPGKKRK